MILLESAKASDWAMLLDFLRTLSVVVAAMVACYGVIKWRRELLGKKRADLAEETLAMFYEARDVIMAIRSPLGYSEEGHTRKPLPYETPEQKDARDRAFVLIERYQKRQELFQRIGAARYRFMALFGADATKPFEELSQVISEMHIAAYSLMDLWSSRPSRIADAQRIDEDVRKQEAIFYWSSQDVIKARLDTMIAEIERTCRAAIMKGA
jgi:hypothetical protein